MHLLNHDPSPLFRVAAFCASALNPDQALGAWLLSATAALSLATLVKQLGRKTPLEAEFLSRKEFGEFKVKVEQEFTALRDRMDDSFRALSDKLDGINNRLHEVRSLVDRVDERTKHLHAWEPQIRHRTATAETFRALPPTSEESR